MRPSASASKNHLLALKLWYLLYFAAQFTQLFIPLILDRAMHFSPSTAGLMMGARRLVIFFIAPLFTWLCDVTFMHRLLLIIAHISYYWGTFLLSQSRSFPAVLAVLLFREACISGCEPTINNAAIAKLQQLDAHVDAFGELRLWGSVGWGVASVVASFIIDKIFASDYIVALYLQIAIGIIVIALTTFSVDLSADLFRKQAERKRTSAVSTSLFTASPLAFFCAVNVFIQGIVFGVLQMTLFLYFAALGVSTAALGLSVLLACVTEGIIFLYTSKIFALCGGAQQTFNAGLLLSCVALLSFALIQFADKRYTTSLFIMVTVFNGGTYALFLTAALAITNELAPTGRTTTAQGTLAALYSGIGPALGSFISGIGYQTIGAPLLYTLLAILQLGMSMTGQRFLGSVRDMEELEKGEREPLLEGCGKMNGDVNEGKDGNRPRNTIGRK